MVYWAEKLIGKRVSWVNWIGKKGGRDLYCVTFEDGTEADYYIDFDRKEVEAF